MTEVVTLFLLKKKCFFLILFFFFFFCLLFSKQSIERMKECSSMHARTYVHFYDIRKMLQCYNACFCLLNRVHVRSVVKQKQDFFGKGRENTWTSRTTHQRPGKARDFHCYYILHLQSLITSSNMEDMVALVTTMSVTTVFHWTH